MPRYSVKAPDGHTYTVEGPAGATDEQVRAEVMRQHPTAARGPAPAKKKSGVLDQIGAFAQSATEQIPFLDEAAAFTASKLYGSSYKDMRGRQKEMAAEDRRERPTARNVGGIAGFGATLAAPGANYVRGAKTFGSATARSAKLGAAYGAVQGAAMSEDGLANRLKGAAIGAGAGATLGAAVPVAAKAAQAVPGAVRRTGAAVAATGQQIAQNLGREVPEAVVTPDVTKKALEYVADLAAKAKLTPDDLAAHPALASGEPVTTAEALGRTGIGQATALSRRTGTTGDAADALFADRAEGAADRLLGHLEKVAKVSPAGAQGGIDAIVEAGRARAKPLFDTALAGEGPVWNPDLEDLAKRPVIRKALASVADDMRNAGEDPSAIEWIIQRSTSAREVQPGRTIASPPVTTETAVPVRHPTAATWDLVKKAIGRQVERHPITGKPLPDTQSQGNFGVGQADRALSGALRKHIPGYAEALDASGDYLTVQGAFNRASGTLFSTKTTPRQFAQLWKSWKSPGEASAARDALAADIFNKAQNGLLKPGRLLVPAVREKLRVAFGEEAAAEIVRRVQIQHKLAASGNRIRPGVNSTTAEAMMAGQEMDNALAGGVAKAGGHLMAGRPMRAVGAVVNALAAPAHGALTPINQATRNEVGRLLLQPPDETAKLLNELARPAKSSNPLARRQ